MDPARLLEPGLDVAQKKRLADAALTAARSAGASYADVRIGRYLNQSIFTREKQVQNIASGECFGAGIRVIANGSWGFAATNDVSGAEPGQNRAASRGNGQGQRQNAEGARAAGSAKGLRRGELEDAHPAKRL
ncbi:MAG: DNA gyrase modulator [Hymenobacter sp.]